MNMPTRGYPAGSGAIAGAVAGGAVGLAAAMAVPGVNVAILLGVVGVGAYTGSLAGALAKLSAADQERCYPRTRNFLRVYSWPFASLPRRKYQRTEFHPQDPSVENASGKHLSAEEIAIQILREAGAKDIERTKGTWQDGEWKDFDPVAPVQLVDTNA